MLPSSKASSTAGREVVNDFSMAVLSCKTQSNLTVWSD
jgi:hypothetical protein